MLRGIALSLFLAFAGIMFAPTPPVGAMDTPICSGTPNSPTATTGAVTYNYIQVGGLSTWQGTESTRQSVSPIAFTASKFYVEIATAPGAGAGWTFVLMVNGSPSTLTCSISDSATTGNDTSNSVSISAGDLIELRATASATAPSSVGNIKWTILSTASSNTSPVFSDTPNTVGQSATNYLALQADINVDSTALNVEQTIPTAGNIKNLYIELDGSSGAGTYAITLMKNGSPQALTATVATSSTTASDTSNSVSVTAGDLLYWKVVTGAGTARRLRVSFQFQPTIDGESICMSSGLNTLSQNLTRYQFPAVGSSTWSSTETIRQILAQSCTVKKLYVTCTAPAIGETLTITSSKNSTPQSTSVIIIGPLTTGNDTSNSFSISAGDSLSTKGVTSTSTGTLQIEVGRVFFISPTVDSSAVRQGDFFEFIR